MPNKNVQTGNEDITIIVEKKITKNPLIQVSNNKMGFFLF